MPLANRVDPYGDLNAVTFRGLFTGNRGCLVNESGEFVRHHVGSLWITCALRHKEWRSPLTAPRHWTPLFFLDDAVALAAGHRPCGLCRRPEYLSYRDAVARSINQNPSAADLNGMLAAERLTRGGGMKRIAHRMLWNADTDSLPSGAVIVGEDSVPTLINRGNRYKFSFGGWIDDGPVSRGFVEVITPPTSVTALRCGFRPVIHKSAGSP